MKGWAWINRSKAAAHANNQPLRPMNPKKDSKFRAANGTSVAASSDGASTAARKLPARPTARHPRKKRLAASGWLSQASAPQPASSARAQDQSRKYLTG